MSVVGLWLPDAFAILHATLLPLDMRVVVVLCIASQDNVKQCQLVMHFDNFINGNDVVSIWIYSCEAYKAIYRINWNLSW